MGKAQLIAEDAQKKLKADGKPISDDRYAALQKLDIHANAGRDDRAKRLVTTFNDYAKGKGLTVVMKSEEISPPPVPSYKQVDADKTVKANGLTGTGADNVGDWVANRSKAGDPKTHADAISKASMIQQKLAAACGKSS